MRNPRIRGLFERLKMKLKMRNPITSQFEDLVRGMIKARHKGRIKYDRIKEVKVRHDSDSMVVVIPAKKGAIFGPSEDGLDHILVSVSVHIVLIPEDSGNQSKKS